MCGIFAQQHHIGLVNDGVYRLDMQDAFNRHSGGCERGVMNGGTRQSQHRAPVGRLCLFMIDDGELACGRVMLFKRHTFRWSTGVSIGPPTPAKAMVECLCGDSYWNACRIMEWVDIDEYAP